jgi:hypothetical protein
LSWLGEAAGEDVLEDAEGEADGSVVPEHAAREKIHVKTSINAKSESSFFINYPSFNFLSDAVKAFIAP